MRLFIAEKPSLGRAIADVLGTSVKKNGYLECGNDAVTWCFGHMMEQEEPEAYDSNLKKWRRDTLPIIPVEWKYRLRADSIEQLKLIGELLSRAASVVHAGDPDREGQLLVDEVLEHFKYNGPVQRIWLASLDERSVKNALAGLKDNADYASLRDAARARSRADWLIGMNATRAMTIFGWAKGMQGVLSQGRVQTPTLNLVVMRDREIEKFKPQTYFVLQATCEHPAGKFTSTFMPSETQSGLDSNGRLVDKLIAESIARSAKDEEGIAVSVIRKEKQELPPLPHSLSSLQKAASSGFGMTAQQTLDVAQSLYEKKLTTYPRTDCRYLPDEQFIDAARILKMLATIPDLEQIAHNADASLCSNAWDTKKVTAHHAIIPTGESVSASLNEAEKHLYQLICLAYCLQFYPPLCYEAQKITVNFKGATWEAKGRRILEPGWTQAKEQDDAKEKEQSLPDVQQGDLVRCLDVSILDKKTTPPPRFTEGSLIEAMSNVHRFVTDTVAKATLKEHEGIGTEATRAGILETLKKRQFIKTDKKTLISTATGRELIDMTPEILKDPATTATWEKRLENVAGGSMTLDTFMAEQVHALTDILAPVWTSLDALTPRYPCPHCGKALVRRKGKDGFFWGCSAYPECRTTLPDKNGEPLASKPRELSEHKCEKCGKPLSMFEGVSRTTGKPYKKFNCSGYPHCRQSYWVKYDGTPDYENPVKPK